CHQAGLTAGVSPARSAGFLEPLRGISLASPFSSEKVFALGCEVTVAGSPKSPQPKGGSRIRVTNLVRAFISIRQNFDLKEPPSGIAPQLNRRPVAARLVGVPGEQSELAFWWAHCEWPLCQLIDQASLGVH